MVLNMNFFKRKQFSRKNIFKINSDGFTLVELLVAAGIFSIIIIAITGIFIGAINAHKYVISTKTILSETEYATDFMSRALRMAVKAKDSACIPSGTSYQVLEAEKKIRFINALEGDRCQEFYLDLPSQRIKSSVGGIQEDLTSPNLSISALKFSYAPSSSQPIVTIYLEARIGNVPPIKLQTSTSQRNLNM